MSVACGATSGGSARLFAMSALYLSMARDDQVVRRPSPTDAIGAALRGVFECPALPEDMALLLRRLDRK